ncbi:MAG: flavin reductase family protein [Paracoccaceae bacterium]|jgi:flavin reductase (DIM6/NTAB) family NADH-FMN oxidoreductase RutF
MFYRPNIDDHGLPHNPFKAIVSPRPIGWISSVDVDGHANLAPYSFFNAVTDNPPMVMFASTGTKSDQSYSKDSVSNIRNTGEFVVNIVSLALKDQMNNTSGALAAGMDEFEHAGLTKATCNIVKAPRVASSPAALECKLFKIVDLPGKNNVMVLGEVIGVHLDDTVIVNGIFDITRYTPLARLGYTDYAAISEKFSLERPK